MAPPSVRLLRGRCGRGWQAGVLMLALSLCSAACNAPKYKGMPIDEFMRITEEESQQTQRQAQAAPASTVEPTVADSGEYRVGPYDVLQITIYGLESLDAPTVLPARVDDGGKITLPLVNEVSVGDLTLTGVEKAITDAYSPQYIRQPRVLAEVKEYHTIKLLMLGGMNGAEELHLRRNERSIFQALAQGGVVPGSGLMVFVQPKSDPQRLESYDLSLPQDSMQALSRPALEDGDIVIARNAPPPMVYVHGLAGGGPLPLPANGLRLRQAIAAVGGPPTEFDIDKVALTRQLHDGRDVCVVFKWKDVVDGLEPNVELRAGDVIEVPHTAETRTEEFIRRAIVFRTGINAVWDPINYYFPPRLENNDYYDRYYSIRHVLAQDVALRASRAIAPFGP